MFYIISCKFCTCQVIIYAVQLSGEITYFYCFFKYIICEKKMFNFVPEAFQTFTNIYRLLTIAPSLIPLIYFHSVFVISSCSFDAKKETGTCSVEKSMTHRLRETIVFLLFLKRISKLITSLGLIKYKMLSHLKCDLVDY